MVRLASHSPVSTSPVLGSQDWAKAPRMDMWFWGINFGPHLTQQAARLPEPQFHFPALHILGFSLHLGLLGETVLCSQNELIGAYSTVAPTSKRRGDGKPGLVPAEPFLPWLGQEMCILFFRLKGETPSHVTTLKKLMLRRSCLTCS